MENNMSGYAILGEQRQALGDGEDGGGGGGGWLNIIPNVLSAAGQGASSLIQWDQKKKEGARQEKSSRDALEASKAADLRAKNAVAKALLSQEMKSGSEEPDRIAMASALAASDEAASGLSPENQKARAQAAKAALDRATAEWQAASAGKDAGTARVKALYARAAEVVYAKTQAAMIARAAEMPGGLAQMRDVPSSEGSWLTRKIVGPVPGWGVLAGVGGLVAVVALARRS